jgi:uncharacterized protein (DUF3084 family)
MRRFALPLLFGFVLVSGMSVLAAAGAATEDNGLSEAWNAVKDFTVEQKDKAVADSQRAMENFDRQMDELDAQASKDSAAISQGWEETKARLAELRANAQTQLDRLGQATAETWDDVKQEFGHAVEDLDDAYDNARKDVQK